MTRDDARLAEIYRLSDAARARYVTTLTHPEVAGHLDGHHRYNSATTPSPADLPFSRALAEAQDAREIAGPDDADVPTATDFRDAAAVIALLIGLGWALKAWWPL